MSQCTHCFGRGRCQDDYHSGSSLFGGEDEAGQNRPGFLGGLIDSCPSCGNGNTESRPECPHCKGTGRQNPDPFDQKKDVFGIGESEKEARLRQTQRAQPAHIVTDSGGGGPGWLEELTIALLWFGKELAKPEWHPAIRFVLTWIMPASFAYGAYWYGSEVLSAFDSNMFDGVGALLLAWIAIPISAFFGFIGTVATWAAAKIGYAILANKQQDGE